MLAISYILASVSLISCAFSSKILENLPKHHVNYTHMRIYFEGIKTVHFFNLPNEFVSEAYLRYFHEQWLIPAFVISFQKKDTRQLTSPRKHSDSEGYVVFINGQKQFISALKVVKWTNPLARCIFVYPKGKAEKVADLHKLAWKLFDLVNVVIVTPSSGRQKQWSLFNPFRTENHDLATMSDAQTYLENMHHFKNLQGYPIRVTGSANPNKKPGLRALGIGIMEVLEEQMKFTIQTTKKEFLSDSEPHFVDVDSYPRLIYDLANKSIVFLHPLVQSKVLFAVPKNQSRISGRFQFNDSLTTKFRVLLMFYFMILNFFGRFHRRIYGPSRETERTYLFLASAGILFNVSLVDFKRLRFVATAIMLAHVGFNAYFQATFFEISSVPYNHDINTLDHLLKTNLRFVTSQSIYDCLREVTGDSRIQQIIKRLEIDEFNDDYFETFSQSTHGLLLIDYKAHHLARTVHDDHGNDLVHVVPEPVHEFYLAMKARKDLPFIRRFNVLISQMIETGMVLHKLNRVLASEELKRLDRVKRGKMAANAGTISDVVTFNELVRTISSHLTFFMLCFVSFFGELMWHYCGECVKQAIGKSLAYVASKCYESIWYLIVGLNTFHAKNKLMKIVCLKALNTKRFVK